APSAHSSPASKQSMTYMLPARPDCRSASPSSSPPSESRSPSTGQSISSPPPPPDPLCNRLVSATQPSSPQDRGPSMPRPAEPTLSDTPSQDPSSAPTI